MATWTKDDIVRGKHYLTAFSTAFSAIWSVIERYKAQGVFIERRSIAGLIEVYLDETGESFNPEHRTYYPGTLAPFTRPLPDGRLELNELGFEIVRAVIFAIRNKTEKVRNQRKERGLDLKSL